MENRYGLTLSEHFQGEIVDKEARRGLTGAGGTLTRIKTDDARSLREWWYEILRNYGKLPCFAVFLVLPSDKVVVKYLQKAGNELNIISGQQCLIIVLGNDYFRTFGLHDEYWIEASANHVTTGESVQVARLFGIDFPDFPCVVFFDDIRSSDFAVVSLKDLQKDDINRVLREVFSIISQNENDSKALIESIQKYTKKQKLREKEGRLKPIVTSFLGKTIETAMEAWIKTLMK